MKSRMLLMVAVAVFVFSGSAGAAGFPSFGNSSSQPAANPDAYLAKAKATEDLVNKSAEHLFGLVASKEEQAKHEEKRKKLAATADPKEQKTIIQEIFVSQTAAINEAANSKDLTEKAKDWDDKKKAQGAASLFNLALGALLGKDLVPEGQNMAKSLQSNPMMLTKAATILESVKTLGGIVTGAGKVVIALPPVFSAAKIDVVLPKTSTEKEKVVDL
jgi:hypothetical protein